MSATRLAFARSGDEMTPPATLADRAKRTVLRKLVDRVRPLAYRRGARGIRCLTFHYLFEHERERAHRLFQALKREGDFVGTAELLGTLESGSARAERLFHLSIDDGFENIATVAHPILEGLDIPYSLMVCPTFVGAGPEGLDAFRRNARYARALPLAGWDELARLAADGVEIGAHTLTHRELSRLSGDELRQEVVTPKAIIENRLGAPCSSFAWPFGRSTSMSEEALSIARGAGYSAVFSSLRGTLEAGAGVPASLPRHHFEPSWPLETVVYYATRAEPMFAPQPLAGHAG
jgi:peptidoglycan/xylan/chitin deacetylase (PgdA/CDA1 family)